MKKLVNKIINWIFFFLIIVLFLFGLMTIFKKPEKIMNLIWERERMIFSLELTTEKEKEINSLIFFNREDGSLYKKIADSYYYDQEPIDLEKTAFYYEKALEYNPQPHIDDFKNLAEVYDKQGEKEKKEKLIYDLTEMLIKRGSKNRNASELSYSLAEEKLKTGDYDKAFDFLDRSLKTAHEPWVFCNLKPLPLLDLDKKTMLKFAERLFPLGKDYLGCSPEYYLEVFQKSGLI